ncbi:GIY-YIG nuclease family protein [Salisediminibacterium halotolerans]|uniref:GIY-YIG nuclease family protein n=1 Tax=Salisediminibacterium halotolerans TaxID=517425 RepID=UPI000F0D2736|nr:GIY-YIG nuclease family protein [Salisediminibacterium halotolerans]RLJ72198.1 T5orf172 domain-containing protein [Actinophytocola xinjiangensis]RPE85411.1 T5orf172 domain-containing protein [Salisediminibacterium halotolerans]TWG33368.1 T5orf172 domain-containing protein [Salisediminibacterium halotolerans]
MSDKDMTIPLFTPDIEDQADEQFYELCAKYFGVAGHQFVSDSITFHRIVNDYKEKHRGIVYVLELTNPKHVDYRYYIGSTARSVAQRLDEHKYYYQSDFTIVLEIESANPKETERIIIDRLDAQGKRGRKDHGVKSSLFQLTKRDIASLKNPAKHSKKLQESTLYYNHHGEKVIEEYYKLVKEFQSELMESRK